MIRKLPFLALLISFLGPSLDAVEPILTDDISVPVAEARTANGSLPYLSLDDGQIVCLKFDLASVLPEGVTSAQIAKATLRLWVSKVARPGACHAIIVGQNNWMEERKSFWPPDSLRPKLGTVFGGFAIARVPRKFITLDVTDIVRSWLDGTPNLGLAVTGTSIAVAQVLPGPNDPPQLGPIGPLQARFDSKENTATGHTPTLQLVLRNVSEGP